MFRKIDREQTNLIPPSLRELIPDDDLVLTVIDVVDQLDLSKLYGHYNRLGSHAYHPKMMLALFFYAYSQGVFSSRRIAERVHDSIRFLYLTGYQYPDFHTINRFRQNHLDLLQGYFEQIVQLCMDRGLVPLDGVAIDGTKVKANASAKKQSQLLLQVAASVEGDAVSDASEDKDDNDLPSSIPSGYSDPDSRSQKGVGPGYNAQLAVDTTTQMVVGAKVVTDRNDSGQLVPMIDDVERVAAERRHRTQYYADTGYASADAFAKLSENGIDAYVPLQEDTHHKPGDPYAKERFIINVEAGTGTCPQGHPLRVQRWNGTNKSGSPIRTFRGTQCTSCPVQAQCTRSKYRYVTVLLNERYRQAMRDKLNTPAGRRAMRLRRTTVEPAFGHIKAAMGFKQFSLRRLKAVKAEWFLVAIAFNLKKMHEILQKRMHPAVAMATSAHFACKTVFCACKVAVWAACDTICRENQPKKLDTQKRYIIFKKLVPAF